MKGLLRLSALLWVAAAPAIAEVARVSGGEHGDFTRLVVEAGESGDWMVGRLEDGYELSMPESVTGYDLVQAFEKIPRDRVASLWQDPESGRLRVSLACACHVVAFEFRPGIVVLDIRNGPAPASSAFEAPLPSPSREAGPETPDGAGEKKDGAAGLPAYDWIRIEQEKRLSEAGEQAVLPLPLPTGEVSLDPLRDALLAQISKGAVEGVVDIKDGALRPEDDGSDSTEGPWSRISVGEMPGLIIQDEGRGAGDMTPDGRACLPDEQLDVVSWGQPGPIVSQLGLARSGLLLEFDAPSAEAILRTARFHVFLGFGAEARQYLDLLEAPVPEEANLLRALARIVDEELPEPDPFNDMHGCNSAAALWATLSDPAQTALDGTNVEALARSFSALPQHLRNHLGGRLVDKFLAVNDTETARKLRDSILRAPVTGNPEVTLMDARFQLADGQGDQASELAESVLSDEAPGSPEAAVTLVEAAFQGNRQIDPGLPSALEVFLRDAEGTDAESRLRRAAALAHLMTGDFAASLALGEGDPETFSDLWSVTAEQASDDEFLALAAEYAAKHPAKRRPVEEAVARRLLAIGLPELAMAWLAGPVQDGDADRRLLTAEVALAAGDARAAEEMISGLEGPDADRIRAVAEVQLGDPRRAAEALARIGDDEAARRAATWTQDWPYVQGSGPEEWQLAAGLVVAGTPADPAQSGPIARGTALADESAEARMAIEGLLAATVDMAPSQ